MQEGKLKKGRKKMEGHVDPLEPLLKEEKGEKKS